MLFFLSLDQFQPFRPTAVQELRATSRKTSVCHQGDRGIRSRVIQVRRRPRSFQLAIVTAIFQSSGSGRSTGGHYPNQVKGRRSLADRSQSALSFIVSQICEVFLVVVIAGISLYEKQMLDLPFLQSWPTLPDSAESSLKICPFSDEQNLNISLVVKTFFL